MDFLNLPGSTKTKGLNFVGPFTKKATRSTKRQLVTVHIWKMEEDDVFSYRHKMPTLSKVISKKFGMFVYVCT